MQPEAFCTERMCLSVPTGYGKSAIFQMLPTCAEMLLSTIEGHDVAHPAVLIISPLISLITDQLKRFNAAGLSAIHLSSQAQPGGYDNIIDTIIEGKLVIFLPVLKPY